MGSSDSCGFSGQKQSPSWLLWAYGVSSLSPEVLSDVVTARPGANVTLTCPGEEPGDSATIHWLLRNRVPGSQQERGAGVGGRLLLRSVQLSDSGNYSCYRDDGSLAGTVPLLVEGQLCAQSAPAVPSNCCYFFGPTPTGEDPLTSASSETGGGSSWVGARG